MAKVVILGAGISGHTAALFARRRLPKEHEVIVVCPKDHYNWIPSNIWVGVGIMAPEQVIVPLRPVYDRTGIRFVQARATEIHPEGSEDSGSPFVVAESTESSRGGENIRVHYDFLVNATGPKLKFEATSGLGPEAHTLSVCTQDHAAQAARAFRSSIERMKKGEKQTLVVGVGHGLCTCEGAAFEYTFNVEFELRRHGVRDKARVIYLTNEAELGDFGVSGLHITRGGYVTHSKIFAESLFAERGVESIIGAAPKKIEPGRVHYETLDGELHELAFDFGMLLPPFAGVGLKAFDKSGKDITSELFAPSGFMKVDAQYQPKAFEEWRAEDWPRTYQNPKYANLFATGIAFAPPHPISRPRTSKNGTPIAPAAPRTGMPSAIMGRLVVENIADMILGRAKAPARTASMSTMGAACVASAGANWWSGSAASMTMYPVVPDYSRFPRYGRDIRFTFGDIGSAGHWIKRILHTAFIYKACAKPGWWLIPE